MTNLPFNGQFKVTNILTASHPEIDLNYNYSTVHLQGTTGQALRIEVFRVKFE